MSRKISVILSYIMMVFEVLSTLLLTPFILKSLGQAEYGVYKLSSSITSYLLLLDLGVGSAVVRYVSKYRINNQLEENRKFFGVSLIFYILIAVITLFVGLVLYCVFPIAFSVGLTHEETILGQKLLVFTILNAAVTLGTATFPNIIIAYEKFAFQKGWSIFQIILKIIFTYVALRLGMKSLSIVVIHLILTILTRSVFGIYVFLKIKLKPKFKGLNFGFIKGIIVFSAFILLQMVATHLNTMIGPVLLGAIVPSATLTIAIYGVGTQIIQYFQSISSAFNSILMPGIVKLVEHDVTSNKIQSEMIRIGRIIFSVLAIIFVCFILYGKQFISVWVGDENLPAFYVTVILMFAYLIINVSDMGGQILWAKNQHKEQSVIKLIIVILNIFLTVILIKWNPLLGVTIGTFVSLMLGDVVLMNVLFKKKIGISLSKYYWGLLKGILPSLIIAGGLGYLFSLLKLSGWLGFICNVAFTVMVYGICMLLFGFNKYEKNLVSSLFSKKLFKGNKGVER